MFCAGAGVVSPVIRLDVPPSLGRNTIVATGACQAKIMRKEGLDTKLDTV